MKTFEELLEDFSQSQINYILVGGLAVDLCGFSRVTEDMDILIERSEENIKKLLGRLVLFGEGAARDLHPDDFTLEEGCIRIVEEFPLDVFTLIKGHSYRDLLSYSDVFITEKGVKIRHLNAEGLIWLKEGSERTKDQWDVLELKKIMKEKNR